MALPEIEIKITADPTSAKAGLAAVEKATEKADAAAAAYKKRLATLTAAEKSGLITSAQLSKALKEAEDAYKDAATKAASYVGATAKVNSVAAASAPVIEKTAKVSKEMGYAVQNAGYQIADMAVMLEMGVSPARVMAQQLPQLIGGFGILGSVIGAGLAVGLPLIAMAFRDASEDGEDLADTMGALSSAMSNFHSANSAAQRGLFDLTAEFGANSAKGKELLEIQRQLAEARARLAFNQASGGVTDLLGGALYSNTTILKSRIDDLKSLYDERARIIAQSAEIEAALDAGADIASPPENLGLALELVEQNIAKMGDLDDVMVKLTEQFGLSTDGAAELALAAARVNEATDMQARVQAARDLALVLDDVTAGFAVGGDEAYALYQDLLDAVTAGLQLEGLDIASGIGGAADEAGRLADNLANAAISQQNLRDAAGTGPGRGSAMSEWQRRRDDALGITNQANVALIPTGQTSTASSGGGNAAVDALVQSLMTQDEIIAQWYDTSLSNLQSANDQQLAIVGGYQTARERLEEEHQRRLNAIKSSGEADGLTTVLHAGSQILGAMGATNERALKMSKAFAAGEALVNTYRAAAQALADPRVPFWGKFSAVASTVAAGMSLVSSIKGIGSGGTSAASTASTAAASSASSGNVINYQVSIPSTGNVPAITVREVFSMINEGLRNGQRINIQMA